MNLSDLTWAEVDGLSREVPVVIPVAALEQHGRHLPLYTDSLLLGEVVRRVSDVMESRILFAPLMWLGNSHHHLDFPGTLSASPRVYLDLLNDLIENMLTHGFRRIVLLNGHGGNTTPGKQAIFEVRQRHRQRQDLLLLFATYWDHGKPKQIRSDLVQSEMGHACEWETSMILRLAPHLVKDAGQVGSSRVGFRAAEQQSGAGFEPANEFPHTRNLRQIEPVDFGFAFEPAYRGWTTKDRTEPGHIGQPAAATAEKGEALFQIFSDGVTQFLEHVIAWDGHSWDAV